MPITSSKSAGFWDEAPILKVNERNGECFAIVKSTEVTLRKAHY